MDPRMLRKIVGTGQQQSLNAIVDAVHDVDLGQPTGPSSAWLKWIDAELPSSLKLVVVAADAQDGGPISEHQNWHAFPDLSSVTGLPAEALARLRRDSHALVLIDVDISEAGSLIDAFGTAALGVVRITRSAAAGSLVAATDGRAPRLIDFVAPSDAKPGPLLARLLPPDMLADGRRAWALEQLMLLAQSVGRIQEERLVHTLFGDWLQASSLDMSREQASLREQAADLVELRDLLDKELAAATSANDGSVALAEFRMTCDGDLRKLISDRFDELLKDVTKSDPPKAVISTTSTNFWGQQFGGALTGLVGHSVTYRLNAGSLMGLAQALGARADQFLNQRVTMREERAIEKIFDFYREPLAALSVRIPHAEPLGEHAQQSSGARAFSGLEGNLNIMLRKEEERDLLNYDQPSIVRSFMQARSLAAPMLFLAGLVLTITGAGGVGQYRVHFLITGVVVAIGYLVAMALTEKPRMRLQLAEAITKLRNQLLEQIPTTISAACTRIPADRKAALDQQVRHVREQIELRIRALSPSLGVNQAFSLTQLTTRPGLAASRSDRSPAATLEGALQTLHDSLSARIRSRR